INSDMCGGSLFTFEKDGTLRINELITENQIYITSLQKNGNILHNDVAINKFLKFKNAKSIYVVDKKAYFTEGKVSDTHMVKIKEAVMNFLLKIPTGSVELAILQTKNHQYRLLNGKKEIYETTNTWDEGDGHAICITGVLDEYFIVS